MEETVLRPELDLPEANLDSLIENEAFQYNKHNESIFDDYRYFPSLKHDQESVVKFDANNVDYINHATLKALIVQLTSPEVIDYNLICDFFLTYRTFTDSHSVLNLLLTRLIWALQYVNLAKPDTEHIGKLVLLRTFVVLRHWILNYFIDDFESDHKLCDAFIFFINQVTHESTLVNKSMVFEHKILTDLKIHWLSQINEFYKAGINLDSPQNIFSYSLPLVSDLANFKKMSKSNTEASIHTNPSFRRSAMLSLYDLKTHHKCLIYDDTNSNDENPQFSVKNLLAQHKSSRTSLNDQLSEFHSKNSRKNDRKPLVPTSKATSNKHNYLNLTDSSLALKKTSNVQEDNADKENITSAGFSTNGNVKLPTSKVLEILPVTPVKKMEYTLKDALTASPRRRTNTNLSGSSELHEVGRKKSIKKIMDGLKKSFNSTLPRQEEFADASAGVNILENPKLGPPASSTVAIGSRVDILSARIIDELEFLIRFYIAEQKVAIADAEIKDDINRTEIEFRTSHITEFKELDVEDDEPLPLSKASDISGKSITLDPNAQANDEEMSIRDLPDLSIDRIDNLFSSDDIVLPGQDDDFQTTAGSRGQQNTLPETNSPGEFSKRSSFGRARSINWNDEGNLNLEMSGLIDETLSHEYDLKERELKTDRLVKSSTQYFDVSSEIPARHNPFDLNSVRASASSISSPSDIENYHSEIADLGIALSPQSMKKTLTLQRINHNDQFGPMSSNKRFSMISRTSSGSLLKRESMKSYLSYDSAFSVSSPKVEGQDNSNLKKKHGFQNLRKLVNDDQDEEDEVRRYSNSSGERHSAFPFKPKTMSMSSYVSKTSSLKKSVRFSTLYALTELPFNDYRESTTSISKSNNAVECSAKLPDITENPVFSVAFNEGRSTAKDSTRNMSGHSSSNSVAIPGISNYALKELAAIPDESFSSKNPIKFALYKLEGKKDGGSSHSDISNPSIKVEKLEIGDEETDIAERAEKVISVDNASVCSAEYQPGEKAEVTTADDYDIPDNTEDILAEINNAATEDAIGYSSDIEQELREKPITPIKTRVRSVLNASSSTPNMNLFLMSVPNSENTSPAISNPKKVLDGYSLTSEGLSIQKVMSSASHVSFVLSYDSKSLAEHFTIIEKDMLQDIDWKELIELQWNKELTPVNSWLEIIVNENYYNKNKGVNLVIARFNLMVNWTVSEILLTRTEEERIAIISRFIHIAHNSLALQNFSTLMQIILALTSEKITRLKSTWKNLPPGDILTLKNLEELTSPLKNFINIRLSTNQIKPTRGCIPFVGLYLSDLVFNAERPKFVKKVAKPTAAPSIVHNESYEKSWTIGDSTVHSGAIGDDEKLINFSRFRTSVHIVKSLSQCIEWSTHYKFAINEELLRKCLYIKSLDEEEMNYCLEVVNNT